MVCQHTDKYTKECLTKRRSLFAYFSKCSPSTQSSSIYDLCHECRRYWAEHQVSEQEATRSYVSYREAHDHDGPLSPMFILSASEVVQPACISAAGESCQVPQPSAGPSGLNMSGLQNLTPMLYGRANPDKRSSDTSVRTRWPNPRDLENSLAQQSRSQAGSGNGSDVSRLQTGRENRKEVIRNQSESALSNPKGVLLLSEDVESLPKWI